MTSAKSTTLTERQVEVLELREQGQTQQEVADRLGTTDSNISAIERAAEHRKSSSNIRTRPDDSVADPVFCLSGDKFR